MVNQSESSDEPARVVLDGVPRIGFDTHESLASPSSMRACMQFMGEDCAYDHVYHMGTSGAAFGLLWHTRKWHYAGDLSDLAVSEAWPEPIRRPFDGR